MRRHILLRARMRRGAAIAGLVVSLASSACVKLPNLDKALANAEKIPETTKVYANDGSLITELHAEQNRELVPLSEVPDHVRNAVLAIEDARFYEHPGIDAQGVMRALTKNAVEGRVVEGGSTITQQLVKQTLIGNQRTIERKVNEAALAYQLEQKFTKDEILERYFNTVYFGRGAYGIQAAAHAFFQKDAKKLKVQEGALLAGLIRSPTKYDPRDPKIAKARRGAVLKRMHDEGWLTDAQFAKAKASALGLKPKPDNEKYDFPYWVDFIKDEIFDNENYAALGATRAERINSVFKGGLRIYTTLDPKLQRTAEKAARSTLPYTSDPYTAQVAVNPKNGQIVSMVGGRNFFARKDRYAKFNLATRSARQPGSSFKPFTLIAALERGIPLSRVYRGGSRVTLRLPGGEIWSPRNYEGNNFGSSLTLKRATALSVNVVYAQVALEVGADKIVEVAKRMGIERKLDPVYAISLGTEEVSPLELATAYTTMATQGYRLNVTPIKKITDSAGKSLYKHKLTRKRVLSPVVAAMASEALAEVMKTGTGRRLALGRDAAGKTGTSEEYSDAWFAGFTPNMVAVTWVGFPAGQIPMRPPRTRIRVFGSSWPGQMWRTFMLEAHKGVPAERFPDATEELISIKVDALGNCIPDDSAPSSTVRVKTFLKGAEPTDLCSPGSQDDIDATPSVIGLRSSDARAILAKDGFSVATIGQYCPTYQLGDVCDQSPRPGQPASYGASATIFISSDAIPNRVPDVVGRSTERARQILIDAGYRVRIIRRSNTGEDGGCANPYERRSGRVWTQTACPGTNAGSGTTISITVN